MKVLGIKEVQVNKIETIQGLLPRVETHTVEEKVEEYKEAMELGSEFPPITVWQKDNEEYWLIDGMHRLMATKRLGRTTIKAEVVELKDMLEAKVVAIIKNRHGLPLTKQEKRVLCQNLYMEGLEIQELIKIFGVSERTVYYWVDGLKRREKPDEIKEKAIEMRRQGYTQEQVAEALNIGLRTIQKWESDEKPAQPAKIADYAGSPDPSLENDPVFIKFLEWSRSRGIPDDVARKNYIENILKEDTEEELEELREIAKKHGFYNGRFHGGRPPKEPPPATEEELYEELKNTLLTWIYQTVTKIGWEKTLKMLDEARERAIEVSKTAKRGW